MKTQLPTALFLDLDDTILNFSGSISRCWREACEQYAPQLAPLTLVEIIDAIKQYSRWYWSDADRHRDGRLVLEQTRREIVREALRLLGTDRPQITDALADYYSKRRTELLTLFPGAVETLQHLRDQGVGLALITNGGADLQRQKIVTHNLSSYFDAILIEGEFGVGKPDARIYHQALKLLEVAPAQAWMVGDNLVWDVAGAQQVGILGIWNDIKGAGLPASSSVQPDRIVRSIVELVPRSISHTS